MEEMTLKNLIDEGVREIYIRSYGYVELSFLGNTWQPFGNKARYIRFVIKGYGDYTSRTFFFDDEEPALDDIFILKEGKWLSQRDFDLACRD
jgi:hypothetical protein